MIKNLEDSFKNIQSKIRKNFETLERSKIYEKSLDS